MEAVEDEAEKKSAATKEEAAETSAPASPVAVTADDAPVSPSSLQIDLTSTPKRRSTDGGLTPSSLTGKDATPNRPRQSKSVASRGEGASVVGSPRRSQSCAPLPSARGERTLSGDLDFLGPKMQEALASA